MCEVEIAEEPRSDAFKVAVARGDEPPERDHSADVRYQPDEGDTYDLEVITEEEAAWTNNVSLVGINPTVQGRDQ